MFNLRIKSHKCIKFILIVCIYIIFYLLMEILSFVVLFIASPDGVKRDVINYGLNDLINIPPFKDENYNLYIHKPVFGKNTDKSPITIFGCSFAYGDTNNYFANYISNFTGRTVYNFSVPSIGPQMMYYAIDKGKIKKSCKTFIYVYIEDHQFRACKFRCTPLMYFLFIRYNLNKDNNLKIEYANWWKRNSFIYRVWEFVFPLYFKNGEYANNIFYNTVIKSYRYLKNENKDINFIILNYASTKEIPDFDKFSEAGIKIINVNDLTGKDMFQPEFQKSQIDSHPNSIAYKLLSSELVKKYDFLK